MYEELAAGCAGAALADSAAELAAPVAPDAAAGLDVDPAALAELDDELDEDVDAASSVPPDTVQPVRTSAPARVTTRRVRHCGWCRTVTIDRPPGASGTRGHGQAVCDTTRAAWVG